MLCIDGDIVNCKWLINGNHLREGRVPFTYECAQCGEVVVRLQRTRSPRVFCSNECYHTATRVHPERACPGCGVTFRPGKRERKIKVHCSRACYEASRKVTKSCPVCGNDFAVNASIAHRYNVCSNACKTADTIYVDCGRCGKRFRAEKHLNRQFCSEECRRPPVYVTCKTCNADFRTQPYAVGAGRQFCSRSCYRKFTGETMLEFRVRQALTLLRLDFTPELDVSRWTIDFALTSLGVAIEADGEYWHQRTAAKDAVRDAELAKLGWHVIRLGEREVNDARDLCVHILGRLEEVPGLEVGSLAPAVGGHEPVVVSRRDRPAFRLNHRKAARVRTLHGGDDGTLPLWGEDEVSGP